jgi:hypothetical protein
MYALFVTQQISKKYIRIQLSMPDVTAALILHSVFLHNNVLFSLFIKHSELLDLLVADDFILHFLQKTVT